MTATPKTPRASKASKWRALVLVLVHVAILVHILHWRYAGETLGPLEPSEGISFAQDSIISAGLIFFVVSALATLIFGRFFCGWGCHLLALQDSCLWLLKKVGIKPKPVRSRILLLAPIFAFIYMFLYPAIYRLVVGAPFSEPTAELMVKDFWATFPPLPIALATLGVAGFAIIYFLGAKGFCTNVCPYGAAFGVADRLAPGRIRVTDACEGCGHCTQVCTSNVIVHAEVRDYGMVVDQECMKCLDCISVCPKDALYFGFGKPALFAKPLRSKTAKVASTWWKIKRWRSYSLIEELSLGILFVAAFFTFRGLYNTIPFLFALAIAGILVFCTVQAARLFYKPKVMLQTIELKGSGKITGSGKLYCGVSVLMIAFWAESAYVHYHRTMAEKGYIELNEVVVGWLASSRELSASQAQLVDETLEHVRIAERLTPLSIFPGEEWELALTSGWLNLLRGDEESFERKLSRAADLLPDNSIPCDGLANFHAAAGRTEQADQWFERATQAAPGDYASWTNWGNYLVNEERFDEARVALLKASSIEGVGTSPLMNLTTYQLDRGDLEFGAETLELILDIEPLNHDARLSLAFVLRDLKSFEESAEQYEIAIANGADNFVIRLDTTLSYNLAGDFERAEFHARAAMELAPERPEPWFALRQIALDRGDTKKAEAYFIEAQNRAQNAPQ
ncbi:MAG: Tfp pilus assembly protein PilF/ferredoxin [Planctomycetota bacterium]|jgi:Tfp pilus assembly protein PilF/ferredoxin